MGFPCYLAMTPAEIQNCRKLPEHMGWMACHFAPHSAGLSNLPGSLPPGSMLLLDDSLPVQGHDPATVAKALAQAVEISGASRVLLDLQRPGNTQTGEIIWAILSALPCPVAVTEYYAGAFDCPVFLPPPPPHRLLKDHIRPWNNREIWLELAPAGETASVTESGCRFSPGIAGDTPRSHNDLHCHYGIAVTKNEARFFLRRTREDLKDLMNEAQSLGIPCGVGLFQELG